MTYKRSRNAKRRRSRMNTLRTRDGDACHICGEPMNFTDRLGRLAATVDHLTPHSSGGGDRQSNLKLAHRKCNHERGNRSLAAVLKGQPNA